MTESIEGITVQTLDSAQYLHVVGGVILTARGNGLVGSSGTISVVPTLYNYVLTLTAYDSDGSELGTQVDQFQSQSSSSNAPGPFDTISQDVYNYRQYWQDQGYDVPNDGIGVGISYTAAN